MILSLVLFGGPAETDSPRTVAREDGKGVLIWKTSATRDEGQRLITAGVNKTNPELIFRLIACIAPPGSKVVATGGGFFSSDVLVLGRAQSGCRGDIDNGVLAR